MDGESIPFEGENRSSMSNLLDEGKYSDVTITCGEDTYAVHKAIICPRSSFFAACCDGNFKEANSGVINLGDDDPVAVKMMIRYLYTGAYAPPPRRNTVIVDTIDRGTHFEQWELYKKEYDAQEKERMVSQGYVFWGNRVRKRVVETRRTPETSANPSAPSPPVASQSSAQNQQFRNGNPRGHGPYRIRPGGRHSGSHRGNHTPNLSRPPAPANSAPAPGASTPAPAQTLSEREPNFKLHAQIYALGEKYEIHDLKALALQKFAYEATVFPNSVSFFNGIKEAYTSTVDQDRGMRDVVVSTALKNRYLIDDGRFQNLLKTTGLGFDLLLKLM